MDDTRGGYRCPSCGERTGVVDSRPTQRGYIRRRRFCQSCNSRFTTVEIAVSHEESLDRWLVEIVELRDQINKLPDDERDLVTALIRVLATKKPQENPEVTLVCD